MGFTAKNRKERSAAAPRDEKARTTARAMDTTRLNGWTSRQKAVRTHGIGRLDERQARATLKLVYDSHAGRAQSALAAKWIASCPMNELAARLLKPAKRWTMGARKWRTGAGELSDGELPSVRNLPRRREVSNRRRPGERWSASNRP